MSWALFETGNALLKKLMRVESPGKAELSVFKMGDAKDYERLSELCLDPWLLP